jgi:oxalate decarboxylase/phosphoglucose isomerase-like protein (cupin superfamily)
MIECYKDECWGQLNMRTILPHTQKPGHRHNHTDEWWFLARGEIVVILERGSGGPIEKLMQQGDQFPLTAGTGHAVRNDGDEEAVLLFWQSRLYDPNNPDKESWEWT